jgi:hypothetical protein
VADRRHTEAGSGRCLDQEQEDCVGAEGGDTRATEDVGKDTGLTRLEGREEAGGAVINTFNSRLWDEVRAHLLRRILEQDTRPSFKLATSLKGWGLALFQRGLLPSHNSRISCIEPR